MKTKIKTLTILLIGFIWSFQTFAQDTIVTTAGTVTTCPGVIVNVPIYVTNFNNVGAITLTLNFNTAALAFTGYTSHPGIAAGQGIPVVNAPNGQVKVSCISMNGINVPDNEALFIFKFNYTGGSSNLIWDLVVPGNCSYADINLGEIPGNWINGSVTPTGPTPVINSQPANYVVNEGNNAAFNVVASNVTSYLWQVSINGGVSWNDLSDGGVYSGTTTANLAITGATIGLNNYQYRCRLSENVCNQIVNSNAATLTVTQTTNNILTTAQSVNGCANSSVIIPVTVDNFLGVTSIHTTLDFDPAFLTYEGYQDLHPDVAAAQVMLIGNSVELNWVSGTQANFGSGTLVEYIFHYNGGNTSVNWNTAPGMNEYLNGISPIPATFVGGAISQLVSSPSFTLQPADQFTMETSNTSFTVSVSGATSLLWEVSTNGGETWTPLTNTAPYSGVTTNQLTITNIPYSLNSNLYRCVATENTCDQSVNSDAASLTVVPFGTAIETTIGTVTICPGGDILVPVYVENFYFVASANMMMSYDTVALTYDTIDNLHPDLLDYGFNASNAVNGQWGFAWISTSQASFGSGKLLDLVFHYNENSSSLNWLFGFGNNVYTNIAGDSLASVWNNGAVTLPGPVIINHPANTSIPVGNTATFTLVGNNIDAYQWQEWSGSQWIDLVDGGIYSGVNTQTLSLSPVGFTIDQYKYRCKVTGICGDQYSNAGILSVISAMPIGAVAPTINGCQGSINVPINVTDFDNVGSFSLILNYSGTYLTYNSVPVVNSQLVGNFNVTAAPGSLTFTFTSSNPISFGSGLLFQILFTAVPGNSNLSWNTGSYFKTVAGSILPSNLTNGSINISPVPGFPQNIQGPVSLCSGAPQTTYTTGGAAYATSYTWDLLPSGAGTLISSGPTALVTFDPMFTGSATLLVSGVNNCGVGQVNGQTITVSATPNVLLPPFASTCINAAPITLNTGTPAGGTYSGIGVVNNTFDPAVAGLGSFIITYTYQSGNCSDTAMRSIAVLSAPSVTLGTFNPVCVNWTSVALAGGAPAGGTYSGPGVNSSTGIMNPSTAGVGNWTITYSYTNSNNCTAAATNLIHVDPCTGIPTVSGMSLEVQPNPNSGLFQVDARNIVNANQLEIVNDLGQIVYKESLDPNMKDFSKSIDLSNQPKGLYFLKLSGDNLLKIEKIILQ